MCGPFALAWNIVQFGLFKEDTVHWFWIGPHDEYERLLKR